MCGICGYTGPALEGLLKRMADAIAHRGPDGEGFLETPELHLANRRLAVIDLPGGDQPIWNEDHTLGIVYNGEIYNFQRTRERLEREKGHTFRTKTDTEVILHLYEEHGSDCVNFLNGMFSFAIHDARRQRLVLARDPMGIKPLFYTLHQGQIIFGSEVKSILQHPHVQAKLDPDGLHLLLNVRFVPSPRTMFEGIHQLPPGQILVFENGRIRTKRMHLPDFEALSDITPDEAGEEFASLLADVVKRQTVADVPLGVTLSGGLDSSALLAGASQAHQGPVRTFCLGFGEPTDELADAALVAHHFGSEHRETTLPFDALSVYPRILWHVEAPKVNATQGYYLSRFVRESVTVALSGLGGDELFLGYDIYKHLWPGRVLIDSPLGWPGMLLRPVGNGVARLWQSLAGPEAEVSRRALEVVACAKDPLRYYTLLRNQWDLLPHAGRRIYTPAWQRRVGITTRDAFAGWFDRPDLPFIEQVQRAELRSKMVDDFLWNEDRTSMANGLEVRVPFLDMAMVRFALGLPMGVKWERRTRKAVMRRGLRSVLPAPVLKKRKWGFTFNPYHQFQKDLRALAIRELTREVIEAQGIFRYDFVHRIIHHPPSEALRWHYFMLWQILGLVWWQEIFEQGTDWRVIEARIAQIRGAA